MFEHVFLTDRQIPIPRGYRIRDNPGGLLYGIDTAERNLCVRYAENMPGTEAGSILKKQVKSFTYSRVGEDRVF